MTGYLGMNETDVDELYTLCRIGFHYPPDIEAYMREAGVIPSRVYLSSCIPTGLCTHMCEYGDHPPAPNCPKCGDDATLKAPECSIGGHQPAVCSMCGSMLLVCNSSAGNPVVTGIIDSLEVVPVDDVI